MFLQNIIEKQILSAKLFNKKGKLIENKLLVKEYKIIKNYLISNYTNKDIVAIQLEKDYRYMLVLLACMSIGITYIPLSIEWPDERIKQIKELSGCHVLREDDIDFYIDSIENKNKYYNNEILYIMFTSGSTGVPKGVKIKRMGYIDFITWCDEYFIDINSNDRMLLTTDFTFDISLVDISLFLTKNLSLYVSNFSNNIYKMLFEIEKYKITTHSTVPYNYSMAMQDAIYEKADFSNLKHIILAGARFPYNLYQKFKNNLRECNVYNAYGPTEATIYCTIHKMRYNEDDLYENNITIGKPFYNNKCIIVDEELLISGKQLMAEYLNNKEKTEEVLVKIDGITYYRSGDIVFKNSKDDYFVVGRKDDTLKVSGYRVNKSDIDAYILELDYINNATTISIEKDVGEHELITYVILNAKIDVKIIRKDLKKIMPSYQIAKYIRIVEEFPVNGSGKICKLTLKKMFLETYK